MHTFVVSSHRLAFIASPPRLSFLFPLVALLGDLFGGLSIVDAAPLTPPSGPITTPPAVPPSPSSTPPPRAAEFLALFGAPTVVPPAAPSPAAPPAPGAAAAGPSAQVDLLGTLAFGGTSAGAPAESAASGAAAAANGSGRKSGEMGEGGEGVDAHDCAGTTLKDNRQSFALEGRTIGSQQTDAAAISRPVLRLTCHMGERL